MINEENYCKPNFNDLGKEKIKMLIRQLHKIKNTHLDLIEKSMLNRKMQMPLELVSNKSLSQLNIKHSMQIEPEYYKSLGPTISKEIAKKDKGNKVANFT